MYLTGTVNLGGSNTPEENEHTYICVQIYCTK